MQHPVTDSSIPTNFTICEEKDSSQAELPKANYPVQLEKTVRRRFLADSIPVAYGFGPRESVLNGKGYRIWAKAKRSPSQR